MSTKVESVNEWKKRILVEIPKEEVQAEFDKILKDVAKKVDIQGFRKGKVPEKVVISRYGEGMIMEATEKLISRSFHKACMDNQLNPAGDPVFEDTKINPKEIDAISFAAVIEIDPEIKIDGYKDLKVKINEVKVENNEIDAIIDTIKNQRAELNETNEPIKKGDVVGVEYENIVIDGAKAETFPATKMFEVGNATLPELNTELTGKKTGDKKDISFTFPKDYPLNDYAGKKASATVEIVQVRAKTLIPLDEEFFKQIGTTATNEEELKVIVKDNVLNKKKNEARDEACEKAVDELLKKNDFYVPEGRIKYYIENLHKNEAHYFNAKNPQPSLEEYLEKRKDEATKAIRRFRILDYIVKTENIKVSAEDVDAYIENIAKMYNYPFEQFKESLRKNGETVQIREELKIAKALNCLIGEVKWEDASK
ncbi:MAG: trigger factor [Chitinivibrionia bacterium]|nr:trigger factor [Chitinivibrionia bacterium]